MYEEDCICMFGFFFEWVERRQNPNLKLESD